MTQLFILPQVAKRFKERSVLNVCLFILAFAVGIYPFLPSVLSLYLAIPFLAIPQGLAIANIGALISHSVSKEKQGAALGINGSLIALSGGIIPIVAGVGSGLIGLTTPFVVGGLCILWAWSILFFTRKKSA